MSEVNLNDQVEEVVDDATVITVPIDTTLTHSGEAADAKTVGDALAQKADKSEVQSNITVNGKSKDAQGNIAVSANDIPYEGNVTVKGKIDGLNADTLKMSDATGSQTIAEAIDGMATRTADEIPMEQGAIETVADKIEEIETAVSGVSQSVSALDTKTETALSQAVNTLEDSIDTAVETLQDNIDALDGVAVKSVNDHYPDANGNVTMNIVPYADNLYSEDSQQVNDSFLIRTTGGTGSLSDGNAWVQNIKGNIVRTGFTPESLRMSVNAMPRVAPPAITAVINEPTFEAYVEQAGTYVLNYVNDAWDKNPSLYGLTVSNTPINGDVITIVWDGETDASVTVTAEPRTAPDPITATIDRDTFIAYVLESSTITLTYTTAWSADLTDYGITVVGDPVAGDQIVVVYVKEVRGHITMAHPTAIVATGWNLYQQTEGYAKVIRYSDLFGYMIGGSYTAVEFSKTLTGNRTTIVPDENGLFNVSENGYVFVTGGGADTYVFTTWSDWTDGYVGAFETYTESKVDISNLMSLMYPYGLCAIDDVYDEIDIVHGIAYSRITRMSYTDENRASAEASGRKYTFDEDYIYIERETPTTNVVDIENEYTVSEHGLEFIESSEVPIYTEILYGVNLKDKLRRDVLTISSQALSNSEKAQVQQNLNVPDVTAVNAVNENIAKLREGIAIIVDGDTASVAVPIGGYAYIKNNTHGLTEGMHKNTSSSAFPVSGGTADNTVFTTVSNGAVNDAVTSLNSNIATLNDKTTKQTATMRKTHSGVNLTLTLVAVGDIVTANINSSASVTIGTGWQTFGEKPSNIPAFQYLSIQTVSGIAFILKCEGGNILYLSSSNSTMWVQGSGATYAS